MSHKVRLTIIFAVEFLAIALLILLVFFAGKKSYTVTFDLDGGTLISGELVQEINQGKNATPPSVVKDGCYLHSWSASYKQITKDITIRAVWEYETTVGLDYISSEDSNYCEIVGCFKDLHGDVYIGAYYNEKKVLGIRDGAFKDCTGITNIFMLDGIISIGDGAFEGCTGLESIVLPDTLTTLGENAFANCTSLTSVTLTSDSELKLIKTGAFSGCTALEEVLMPNFDVVVEPGAFEPTCKLTYTMASLQPALPNADGAKREED